MFRTSSILYFVFSLQILSSSSASSAGHPCVGKPEGTLRPDQTNCRQYLECQDSIEIIRHCPEGQIFDKGTTECTDPADYPCSADPKNPTLIGSPCEGVEEQIRPSVVYCDKYLLCLRGTFVPIDCGSGMIFSEKTYKCIVKPDPCTPQRLQGTPDKSKTYIEKNSPYIGACHGKKRHNASEPMHCERYIFCKEGPDRKEKNGVLTLGYCVPGRLYNEKYSKCGEPSRVTCNNRWRNVTTYGPDPGSKKSEIKAEHDLEPKQAPAIPVKYVKDKVVTPPKSGSGSKIFSDRLPITGKGGKPTPAPTKKDQDGDGESKIEPKARAKPNDQGSGTQGDKETGSLKSDGHGLGHESGTQGDKDTGTGSSKSGGPGLGNESGTHGDKETGTGSSKSDESGLGHVSRTHGEKGTEGGSSKSDGNGLGHESGTQGDKGTGAASSKSGGPGLGHESGTHGERGTGAGSSKSGEPGLGHESETHGDKEAGAGSSKSGGPSLGQQSGTHVNKEAGTGSSKSGGPGLGHESGTHGDKEAGTGISKSGGPVLGQESGTRGDKEAGTGSSKSGGPGLGHESGTHGDREAGTGSLNSDGNGHGHESEVRIHSAAGRKMEDVIIPGSTSEPGPKSYADLSETSKPKPKRKTFFGNRIQPYFLN